MRIAIDIFLIILFLLGINHEVTGQWLHEIIGLLMAVVLILHLAVNRKYMILFRPGKKNVRSVIKFMINIALFIVFFLLILSGVMISGYLFPAVTLGNPEVWSKVHGILIYFAEGIAAVHVMFHIPYLAGTVRTTKIRLLKAGILLTAAVAVILVGVKLFVRFGDKNTERNMETVQNQIQREIPEDADITKITTEVQETQTEKIQTGILEISFDYNRAGTPASNQYAIWVEDENGNVIRTLYAGDFTVNGGYTYREDSLPAWVERADPAGMSNIQLDAVSGATPRTSGRLTYQWDGTDDNGNPAPDGTYTFYLEGTLYWSSILMGSGTVTMGAEESTEIEVSVSYTEETETNRDMIENISARYIME